MASPIEVLGWASMTAVVNEIQSPNNLLRNLLFSRHQTFSTETVEIDKLTGDRKMAPFVRRDAEGALVGGLTSTLQTVTFPNIRIKRPFTASELLFGRRPGTVIFPSRGEQLSALEQHVARDLQYMSDMIANREEWMCAQAIRGALTYSVTDQDHFTVTYGKPGGHTFNSAVAWSSASTATPSVDFLAAKRLIADAHSLSTDICLMSKEAAANFVKIQEVKDLLDNRRFLAGQVTLQSQFLANGALYLGNFCGVECWEYGRAAVLEDGTTEDLIRAGYVEFLSISPEADNALYYGAIPDVDALEGRLFQGERFSKSWVEKDPSVRMALVHSRPLPVMRRPGSCVSIDTTP